MKQEQINKMSKPEFIAYLTEEAKKCFDSQDVNFYQMAYLGSEVEEWSEATGNNIEGEKNYLVNLANRIVISNLLKNIKSSEKGYNTIIKPGMHYSDPTDKEIKELIESELREDSSALLKIIENSFKGKFSQEKLNKLENYSKGDFSELE